jgi:hypothetical protein
MKVKMTPGAVVVVRRNIEEGSWTVLLDEREICAFTDLPLDVIQDLDDIAAGAGTVCCNPDCLKGFNPTDVIVIRREKPAPSNPEGYAYYHRKCTSWPKDSWGMPDRS